jgi:hypothetical protein
MRTVEDLPRLAPLVAPVRMTMAEHEEQDTS